MPILKNNTLSSPAYSQTGKNVSIRIYTTGTLSAFQADNEFVFPVNPEEFNIDRQERVQVVQTLGDPFVDDFGIGLSTLNIRGTTGWRTRPGAYGLDGKATFDALNKKIIGRYHELRLEKQKAGLDPDLIKMVVVNTVDELVYRVVPVTFKLMRNRNRPLLYQLDLSFRIVEDLNNLGSSYLSRLNDPLGNKLDWQSTFVNRIKNKIIPALMWVNEKIIQPAAAIYKDYLEPAVNATIGILSDTAEVLGVLKSGAGVVASTINSVAQVITRGVNNVQGLQHFINDLPLDIMVAIGHLESAWNEVTCYLSKGAKESWLPDFSPIHGVNDCASTYGVKDGRLATTGAYAIEWITDLKEASLNSGSSKILRFQSTDGFGNVISLGDEYAPLTVNNTLGEKMDALLAIDVQTSKDVKEAFDAVSEVIASVSLDGDKVASDIETQFEDMAKLERIKEIMVTPGETLQSIALKQYNDINRWKDIAAINDIVIESPDEIYLPTVSFTFDTDLVPGDRTMDLGITVPTDYASAGSLLSIVDASGKRQKLHVKSVAGSVITLRETFSRLYEAPIHITRYENRAAVGQANGTTTLSAEWAAGSSGMTVSTAKDIYLGFKLYLQGENGSRIYTVKTINYLEKTITVDAPSMKFPAGTEIQIYDTESGLYHMQPGSKLKIPVLSTDQTQNSQTDAEIFGVDIALDENGKLRIENGDMATVSGLDNLEQAIRHRVQSPFGSIMFHQDYGCGVADVIGEKGAAKVRTLTKAAIVEALNNEPRIDSIRNLEMVNVGDTIEFSVQAITISENTSTDMNFVLEV